MRRVVLVALSLAFVAAGAFVLRMKNDRPTAQPEDMRTARTETDAQEISELLQEYAAAVFAGDVDRLIGLYADDAINMVPNTPPAIGKEAIRARFLAGNEIATFEGVVSADEVHVSGDLAFLLATYDETGTPRTGGEPTRRYGKWIIVLQRQTDGSWKWWREMWNVYTPPDM
jgi:uncharacterized protein (TIGR02246 family)